MNNINNNPVWGSWMADSAGIPIGSGPSAIDDMFDIATFYSNTTSIPDAEPDPTSITDAEAEIKRALNTNGNNTDTNVMVATGFHYPGVMGTGVGGNPQQISEKPQNHPMSLTEQAIENKILNFNDTYPEEYEFVVEESGRAKNKPYEVEDNCIVAKRKQAIKIKVSGAKSGHIVKMFMRFKDETCYQKPVMACRKHDIDDDPNPAASFYVVHRNSLVYGMENPIKYETEDGHPTAIMTVPSGLLDVFCFSPIFRCWNSCNGHLCREQQMIFRLYESNTGKMVHSSSFDIRICENVGRDSQVIKKEKKNVKRLKGSTSKKVSPRKIKSEEDLQEGALALDPCAALMTAQPRTTSNFYMVEMDDELRPVLEALVKVRGKTMVRIDPTSARVIGDN